MAWEQHHQVALSLELTLMMIQSWHSHSVFLWRSRELDNKLKQEDRRLEEHKFEEEADRTGERTGSYSYQAPDGTLVKVRYTAGRDGFVILNPDEVLPQAPQV